MALEDDTNQPIEQRIKNLEKKIRTGYELLNGLGGPCSSIPAAVELLGVIKRLETLKDTLSEKVLSIEVRRFIKDNS